MADIALSIGDLARRTGLSVSAIRFYETKGLIFPERDRSGRRVFQRSDIRKLSFILIAQQLGFSIREIKFHLQDLPHKKAPTLKDWNKISRAFRKTLDQRIDRMVLMRDRLEGCIGCGCLSLKKCRLYNAEDRARGLGPGPRYLMGDTPNDT